MVVAFLVRQTRRRLAYVKLTSHYVGNEGALSAEKPGADSRVAALSAVMGGDYWKDGLSEALAAHETPAFLTEGYAKQLRTRGSFMASCWTPISERASEKSSRRCLFSLRIRLVRGQPSS